MFEDNLMVTGTETWSWQCYKCGHWNEVTQVFEYDFNHPVCKKCNQELGISNEQKEDNSRD